MCWCHQLSCTVVPQVCAVVQILLLSVAQLLLCGLGLHMTGVRLCLQAFHSVCGALLGPSQLGGATLLSTPAAVGEHSSSNGSAGWGLAVVGARGTSQSNYHSSCHRGSAGQQGCPGVYFPQEILCAAPRQPQTGNYLEVWQAYLDA